MVTYCKLKVFHCKVKEIMNCKLNVTNIAKLTQQLLQGKCNNYCKVNATSIDNLMQQQL